eukprot:2813032-Pyramimonas_sp.AAC.1
MFLEYRPDVLNQDRLRQKCSKNMSWQPQQGFPHFEGASLRLSSPSGVSILGLGMSSRLVEPGRFATAR